MSENAPVQAPKVLDSTNEFDDETGGLTMAPPAFSLLASSTIDSKMEDDISPVIYQELKQEIVLFRNLDGEDKFPLPLPIGTWVVFEDNDSESPRRAIKVVQAKNTDQIGWKGYILTANNSGISDGIQKGATITTSGWGEKTLLQQDTQLYAEADTESSSEPIARNTHVQILNKPNENEQGWAEVMVTATEKKGFVRKTALLYKSKNIPEGTELHNIQGPEKDEEGNVTKNGETLEGIIQQYYPSYNESFADRRTIANVILDFNNPENKNEGESIHVVNSDAFLEGFWHGVGVNYDDISIRANHDMLIPSWDYVLANLSKVKSGSMTEGLVSEFWPDGFGAHFAGSLLAGFLFIEGGIDASVYFYRQGGDIIINCQAVLLAGVAAGVGAGIHFGKKGKSTGLALSAGAEASAHDQVFGMAEIKIPLRAGLMVNFLTGMIKAGVTMNKKDAAEEFMKSFQGDPLHYLNKFEMGLGIKGQAQASVDVGLGKAGEKTKSRDHGGGFESTTTSSTNSNRNAHEENINRPERKTLISGIKDLLKNGSANGLKEHSIWKLSNQLRELTNFGAKAEAGISGGVEYDKPNGKERFSVYIEGKLLAELDLPMLNTMTIGGKGAIAIVFENIGNAQNKHFVWKGPEAKFGKGDMDNPNEAASEYSIGLATGMGDTFEEIVANSLASIQVRKRFSFNWQSHALFTTLNRIGRVKALMPKDYKSVGALVNASILVGLDFGALDTMDASFQNQLASFKDFLGWDGKNGSVIAAKIQSIVRAIETPEKAVGLAARFLELIVQPSVLSEFTLHAEAGAGIAAGGNVKVGVEVRLDGSAEAGLIFHHDFADEIAAFLSDKGMRKDVISAIKESEEAVSSILAKLKLEAL